MTEPHTLGYMNSGILYKTLGKQKQQQPNKQNQDNNNNFFVSKSCRKYVHDDK